MKAKNKPQDSQLVRVHKIDIETIKEAQGSLKKIMPQNLARSMTISATAGLTAHWFNVSISRGVIAIAEREMIASIEQYVNDLVEKVTAKLERVGSTQDLIKDVKDVIESKNCQVIERCNRAHPIYGFMRPGETNEQADRETRA